jgi:hypothetical protein
MLKQAMHLSILSCLLLLALAACGPQEVVMIVVTATPDPAAATATLVPTIESTATQEAGTQVTTRQDLNMRSGDSTAYGVMTVIPGGQTVDVIGINQAGTWYQVRYHDAIGWISIGFTDGDVPAGLPVATPSAAPQTGGGGGGGGNQGGGSDPDFDDDSFITLNIDDGDQKSVSGTIETPGDDETDRIFITVEGWDNANGDYEVDIAFQCETDDNDDVVISAAGADDGTICNNNWSHEVTEDNNRVMIVVTIPGGGELKWTVIANVGEQ